MPKASVFKNGLCHRRELEENKIKYWMTKNGWTVDDKFDTSDVIVFISCAFNEPHYLAALTELETLAQYKDHTYILGCLPDIDISKCEGFHIYGLDVARFIQELRIKYGQYYPYNDIRDWECDTNVKILDGCLNNCNYCNIKKATHWLKSVPQNKVIEAVIEQWNRNSVPLLLGEDAGAWGQDIGSNIKALLIALRNLPSAKTIRLDNMDVYWLMKYWDIFDEMIESGFIDRIALGIQSFSSGLLSRMNRRNQFDMDLLIMRLRSIIEANNNEYVNSLDLHLLTGHPAETEEDHLTTMKLLGELSPNRTPYTVFKCWIMGQEQNADQAAITERRYNELYSLAGEPTWACAVCKMKKHECLCKYGCQLECQLGIHMPHSATGENSVHT